MRPVLSREEMRAFDAHAISSGVPGIVLMENAGRGAAHLIGLKLRPRTSTGGRPSGRVRGSCVRCADEKSLQGARVVIVCGPGNNGGDGFVVGRQLLGRAADVRVVLCTSRNRLSGDADLAARAFEAVGGNVVQLGDSTILPQMLAEADVVVDALLGTGVTRTVEGSFERVISSINQSGRFVVALDLPSGLDAESGCRHGISVKADHTVTFAHLKTGLLTTIGAEDCGRITVSHIGVPADLPAQLQPSAWLLEESDVAAQLFPRPVAAHKKNVGHVGVLGGSEAMVGALRLCGTAALRAGAGLCTLVSLEDVIDRLEGQVEELMTARHRLEPSASGEMSRLIGGFDALVVGPGLGRQATAHQRVEEGLLAKRPTVLDADGLRAVEGRLERLRGHPALVLTPHAGEAAGLLGVSSGDIEADRYGAARTLADQSGAVVVLKGPRTLIAAPNGPTVVSAFGNSALATGGTGDVLAGIIGGLLACASRLPGFSPARVFALAWTGVALHGLSAECWVAGNGGSGLLASDLLSVLPREMQRLLDQRADGA